MSLIQQVLALYQGAVKTGDSVELKLGARRKRILYLFQIPAEQEEKEEKEKEETM